MGQVSEPASEVIDAGREHVAPLLETKPEVVSFHFGLPESDVIRAINLAGIFILSSAATVAEARLLQQRGVDAIIAQGTEAGVINTALGFAHGAQLPEEGTLAAAAIVGFLG